MKITKSQLKQIIKEELGRALNEALPAVVGLTGAGSAALAGGAAGALMGDRDEEEAAAPEVTTDVATLAQVMERHPDVQRAIDKISNAAEAQEAITYLIRKLGEKNLPVAMIITSMAKSLHQARQAK